MYEYGENNCLSVSNSLYLVPSTKILAKFSHTIWQKMRECNSFDAPFIISFTKLIYNHLYMDIFVHFAIIYDNITMLQISSGKFLILKFLYDLVCLCFYRFSALMQIEFNMKIRINRSYC